MRLTPMNLQHNATRGCSDNSMNHRRCTRFCSRHLSQGGHPTSAYSSDRAGRTPSRPHSSGSTPALTCREPGLHKMAAHCIIPASLNARPLTCQIVLSQVQVGEVLKIAPHRRQGARQAVGGEVPACMGRWPASCACLIQQHRQESSMMVDAATARILSRSAHAARILSPQHTCI